MQGLSLSRVVRLVVALGLVAAIGGRAGESRRGLLTG